MRRPGRRTARGAVERRVTRDGYGWRAAPAYAASASAHGPHYARPVLHDRAKIFVQGGAGGNGVVSFRREAHVPKGGPDGGDGGRGADVVLVCDPSLRDLRTFKRKAHYKATRGGHGEGGEPARRQPRPRSRCACRPGTVVDRPRARARRGT